MTAYKKQQAPITEVGLEAGSPNDAAVVVAPMLTDHLGRFVVSLKVGGLQDCQWVTHREDLVDFHRYLGEMLGL